MQPLEAKILSQLGDLQSRRQIELTCRVIGSRPSAKISWYKAEQAIGNNTVRVSSIFRFVAISLIIINQSVINNLPLRT